MKPRVPLVALVSIGLAAATPACADDVAAARGKKALETRALLPTPWSLSAYEDAWRHWDGKPAERPEPYGEAFRDYYGLHPAPFDNGKYPMGLRIGQGFWSKGLTTDCLLCHAGSVLGKSYVGLGNASLDVHAFFEDLARASGAGGRLPFTFSYVRGTSEAGNMAVYLLSLREPDLRPRLRPLDLGWTDHLCEDVPAWWLLRKKKTMYHTGTANARSVRSLMQFLLAGGTRTAFEREEPTFRDIQAYLLSLKPPPYPLPIDRSLARQGEGLFNQHCARCHGTYGQEWTYPNKIVPIEVIGTDRTRLEAFSPRLGEHYNRSWFAQEKPGWLADAFRATEPAGYQAPPLDGIWATAPYLHNGSVPTLYHVLNSRARPQVFTRSYRTGLEDYDAVRVGWKIEVLPGPPSGPLSGRARRQIYDTTQPGRGNGGHTFGDALSEDERRAVIEYLKTL